MTLSPAPGSASVLNYACTEIRSVKPSGTGFATHRPVPGALAEGHGFPELRSGGLRDPLFGGIIPAPMGDLSRVWDQQPGLPWVPLTRVSCLEHPWCPSCARLKFVTDLGQPRCL